MTATDELRRLLDERGVEHYDGWSGEIRYTKWQGSYDMWFLTHDSFGTDGKLLYVQGIDMTPAQAVEATLGRVTCRQIETEEGFIVCSECGAPQPEDYTVYYCWCCGRKVVDA